MALGLKSLSRRPVAPYTAPEAATLPVLLRAAAARVTAYGLWKGGLFPRDTDGDEWAGIPITQRPVCALGALQISAGYSPRGDLGGWVTYDLAIPVLAVQAEEALAEYLIRVHQAKPIYDIHHNLDTYWVVTAWSDQPKRTAEEVVAVLLACAVEETRREQEARA